MDCEVVRALLTHAPFGELLDALDGVPMLTVRLDGAEPRTVTELAERARELPILTVGVGAADRADAERLDLLLTPDPAPARPWVSVPDPELCVRRLHETVRAHPHACTTLAGTLRLTERASAPDGLIIESLAYSTLLAGPEFGAWLAQHPRRPRRAWPDPPVRVTRSPGEVRVTLARPENRNAVSAQLRDALVHALTPLCADAPGARIVVDALGPDFCSGGDLDEFGTAPDPATAHLVRTGHSAGRCVHALAGRVTVRLHGACVGAGIEIPAFAGNVLAGAGTRIRLPEIGMGLIPGAGGTTSIPRRIGRHRTAYLALSADPISADTALRWGLVDDIDPTLDT